MESRHSRNKKTRPRRQDDPLPPLPTDDSGNNSKKMKNLFSFYRIKSRERNRRHSQPKCHCHSCLKRREEQKQLIKIRKRKRRRRSRSSNRSQTHFKKRTSELITPHEETQHANVPSKTSKNEREIKVEVISGILQLGIMISSLMTVVPMALLTSQWEEQRRRCPLFIDDTPDDDVYWGNLILVPCAYSAYAPLVPFCISLTLVVYYGGIVNAYRNVITNDSRPSHLARSRNFLRVTLGLTIIEFIISFSVACVISDGLRRTCETFLEQPWPYTDVRSCKEGYYDRDQAYHLAGTYTRIIIGMTGAWIATILGGCAVVLFANKHKFCKC